MFTIMSVGPIVGYTLKCRPSAASGFAGRERLTRDPEVEGTGRCRRRLALALKM
jgi:hypothetical protein